MVPQLKDLFFKDVTEHHARDLLDLLQLGGKYEILDADRNKELIVRRRESDYVLKVRIDGKIYLFHLEFISRYSRHAARKAYGYGGALTAKHDCDVITVLVVLKPPSKETAHLGYYEVAPAGQSLNQHGFAVIDVSALRERILAGEKGLIGLAPILPEISGRVDKKLLARQRELIRSVEDPKRQAELLFYTMAFDEPYFGFNFVHRYFMEAANMSVYEEVLRMPVFGDLLKQRTLEAERKAAQEAWDKAWAEASVEGEKRGERRGEKRGEKKGKTEALHDTILQILKTRFGPVNGQIEQRLKAIDEPKQLKRVVQLAVKAYSLQEFKDHFMKRRTVARKKVAAH